MKTRLPDHDLEEIMPILMAAWRKMHKESGPIDKLQTREFRRVCDAVQNLQIGLESVTFAGSDYFSDKEFLGSYILYNWVVHYQQGLSILGELPRQPNKVLDVCSGPGAFALAALKHGATDVTALDQNMDALQLASNMCGRAGFPLKIRQFNVRKQDLFKTPERYDLIIVGHALLELFPKTEANFAEKQIDFVTKLQNLLTPDGFLVIVDSSRPEINHRILQIRDTLVGFGTAVQAPCIWKGPCPALQTKNSPCYAQREFYKPYIVKEIQRALNINLSSLKMTYIIFKAKNAPWPKMDEKPYYRIISPPVESIQGKRYYICGTQGKKNIGSRIKDIPKDARAFEYIKRGELITFNHIHEHLNAIDLIEGSSLKIAAACGKPIPEEL